MTNSIEYLFYHLVRRYKEHRDFHYKRLSMNHLVLYYRDHRKYEKSHLMSVGYRDLASRYQYDREKPEINMELEK